MGRRCYVFAIMFLALVVFVYFWGALMTWLGRPPWAYPNGPQRAAKQAAPAGSPGGIGTPETHGH
jgi:hypothetical protein